MKYPLFGIIYNWKGLKEENYLYTAEELKKFDKELYDDCMKKPDKWHDSTMPDCSWKTWMGIAIKDKDELKWFLAGNDNDTERVEYDEDWYWENVEDNDLYGYKSNTMIEALAKMKIED
ncbi:MAG: hypothetical protein UH850_14780 [Paludibacteraceae bacterium]|nr:hypothetical protein [Paludibacteraceae bacterium]